MEVKVIGQMDNTIDHTFESANRVYDVGGLCPTINTCGGGGLQPKIIDDIYKNRNPRVYEEYSPVLRSERIGLKIIVAMRGRNPDNPSDRTVGAPTEQRLEPNSQGICNTLTSVQKDNLVMERKCISTKGKEDEVASTILAGYERTNMTGFNADNGVVEAVLFDRSGYVRKTEIANTLTANEPSRTLGNHNPIIGVVEPQYRIRKLTPKECWCLMDFKDADFEKATQVNSNTQLYKQAGNSIVKNVLVAILGQMIPGKENVYKEINNAKT